MRPFIIFIKRYAELSHKAIDNILQIYHVMIFNYFGWSETCVTNNYLVSIQKNPFHYKSEDL